jgi:DNA (cytosine-5)-methyltransferase 1
VESTQLALEPAAQAVEERRLPAVRTTYSRSDGRVKRRVQLSDGSAVSTSLADEADQQVIDPLEAFEQSELRADQRPVSNGKRGRLRVADLFSGVGGLSVGAEQAAWALGLQLNHVLAADADEAILDAYQRNFSPARALSSPIEEWVDGELGAPPTEKESELLEQLGGVDLMLAGPPCQGHSSLNNHTRRDDPRNALYLRAVRFAEVARPEHVVIENVPGVLHDRGGVVFYALSQLTSIGYEVSAGVLKAEDLGSAQRRRRYVIAASLTAKPSVEEAVELSRRTPRNVMWAIDDLGNTGETMFDSSPIPKPVNQERMQYLIDHDLYELPDSERPPCHRDKAHTYQSVYGRMYPDRPAPTITIGFGTNGRGRFVHPYEARTLTPHEAARVQSFPDWFSFDGMTRGQTHKAIGNAVPPRMAAAVVQHLLTL